MNTMFKSVRLGAVALASLALFAVSCNEDGSADARDAARAAVTSTTDAATNAVNSATDAVATAATPTGPTTTMTFAETEYDFGTVTEGEKVSHTYTFTNEGDEPLILSNAKGSCGCTVPQWPREPIAPGATGDVTVEFNSRGKSGDRNQKVTITANTNPAQTFIYLKGKVEKGEENAPIVQ